MSPSRKNFTIALIHNLKPPVKNPDLPADYYSECDSAKAVKAIARALRSNGSTVLPVEADQHLPEWLENHPVDLAFSIAEGFGGESREARVPALLELLDIPYTGSGVLGLALAMDKCRSKQIFRYGGIPTPNFQLFGHPDEPLDQRLHFPLIVKPNCEGSAKGIWASSVVSDEGALRAQVHKIRAEYAQDVLVEEFIDGKELTVGILGNEQILPVLEIDFSRCEASGESFYSWRMKEFQGNQRMHLTPTFWCPARLNLKVTQAVQAVALKAARALACRDIARVDIRLSDDGIPFVLEVNPLPGLDPEESNFPIMAQAAGLTFEALIHRIVSFAVERHPDLRARFQFLAPAAVNTPGAHSSIPLSKKSEPESTLKRRRALPDSKEKMPESAGDLKVPVRGRDPRKQMLKEEDLGR